MTTDKQRRIFRLLYDPQSGQSRTSRLHSTLRTSATALVQRGWIWKQEGQTDQRSQPIYGLNPEGIAAAQAAWQDN
jgi:DNA-binding MarR family transcriptional regulator